MEERLRQLSLSQTTVSLGVGTSTGTLYVFSKVIARELGRLGVGVQEVETRGPVDNLEKLEGRMVDLAGVPGAELHYRTPGLLQQNGVRLLFPLFRTQYQLVVRRDRDVSSWAEIKGRRINVGQKGFSGLVVVRDILEQLGITFEDFRPEYLTHDVACSQLRAGRLDGVIAPGAAPHPAIVRLSAEFPIDILPLRNHELERVLSIPYLSETQVPPVYQGISQPITTVGEWFILACRQDLDDAIAQQLTERWWDMTDEMTQIHQAAASLPSPSRWNPPMPLHQGVESYYKHVRQE
ncbi:MAG: TAXI family TRAP transporter solute-binding subunit [Betaproteobacteria bacterium]|nr:TAXI family TRAP transporter solute-binding subunit [Betaproteobacteria bacterium]